MCRPAGKRQHRDSPLCVMTRDLGDSHIRHHRQVEDPRKLPRAPRHGVSHVNRVSHRSGHANVAASLSI